MKTTARALAVVFVLVCAAVGVAAQGVNARYLPFPESRLRRFPLTRYEFPPNVPVNGQPFNVSGVTIRDMQVEVGGATHGVEEVARRLVISGREKGGGEWRMDTEPHMHYDAVYEGDLDRNGIRDLVIALGTGANGLGPPTHLIFLTFDRVARPTMFEASGYFDARRGDIYDLTDLDGDGRAELLYMVYDDGYWITELYRPRDSRWERVGVPVAGLRFPLYTRFTERPNHKPVRPAPGRNPQAPDLIEENRQQPAPDAEAAAVDARCLRVKPMHGVEIIDDERTLAGRLAETREWCRDEPPSIDFTTHTLIGVSVRSGSCPAGKRFRHRLVRDDAGKRYLVSLEWQGNPCRGLGVYDLWLSAPKLPEGYKVEYEVRRARGEEREY